MIDVLRVLAALALGWAVVALTAQVVIARGGGRREYSARTGRAWRGLLYNFTTAMLPAHKESAHLHRAEFATGVVLHVGVLAALAEVVLLIAMPGAAWTWLAWPPRLGLVAGLILFVRRIGSPRLRAISSPDDYLAVLATCGLLALAGLPGLGSGMPLLAYAGVLFVYLPLGKLRHAVFFFVARADLGWRLGYRGVYPPARQGTE